MVAAERGVVYTSVDGRDVPQCGRGLGRHACKTLRWALSMATASVGDTDVLMESGDYPTGSFHNEVHGVIHRSINIRSLGGVAVLDCRGSGSGLDIMLSSYLNVTLTRLTFRSCFSGRTWNIGPIPAWCFRGTHHQWEGTFGCGCSLQYCSMGGAVTITNASASEVVGANVVFEHCNFELGSADRGGGVQIGFFQSFISSTLLFIGCYFQRNIARLLGGAAVDILVETGYSASAYSKGEQPGPGAVGQNATIVGVKLENSTIVFEGCIFEANEGATEGAVALWGLAGEIHGFHVSFLRCTFLRNFGGNGAALAFHFPLPVGAATNTLLLDQVKFLGNIARSRSVGGAIMANVPKSFTSPASPVPGEFRRYDYSIQIVTQHSIFEGNIAYVGGAYAVSNGLHKFLNVSFVGNEATHTGGAICLGCVGGGDAGLFAKAARFSGNTAAVAGSTFSSASSGGIALEGCTFDLTGSHSGLTDFEAIAVGPFWADSSTSWRCKGNQQMLKPERTVSQGTSGRLQPEWNDDGIEVLVNHLHVMCSWCAPLTYDVSPPLLRGPVHSDAVDASHPLIAQGTWSTHGSSNGCLPCPFGGTCTGDESMLLARKGQFGLACQTTSAVVDMQSDPEVLRWTRGALSCGLPGDVMARPFVLFEPCPEGYCGGGKWTSPCAGNRAGLLCGSCQKGFSRALSSTVCLSDDECSAVWLIPIVACVCFYATYCYLTGPSPYSLGDMFIFHFQIYGYVLFQRSRTAIVASWLSANFEGVVLGKSQSSKLHICIMQGVDQVQLFAASYVVSVAVLLCIVCIHGVGLRFLLPVEWRINSRDHGQSLRLGSEVVFLALTKGYLGIFNTLVGATVHLVNCTEIIGMSHRRLYTEADVECFRPWQIALFVLLPLLLLSMLLPISLACAPLSCESGGGAAPPPVVAGELRRWVLRLRVATDESRIFRRDRWWGPQAFALSRGLFASVPAVFPSPAHRALANGLLLVSLMVFLQALVPFRERSPVCFHATQFRRLQRRAVSTARRANTLGRRNFTLDV
eukprot:TRINITY_DN15561_c0_g1_i2.p1 TRINITY_DN15561_c0_g1~~TRINITY_DN15561_c0_g1_i2.p1  ORF type:complete len:1110 (-),score=139.76 TRINITY_DN15561_c0_g1_i2:78-3173(-)